MDIFTGTRASAAEYRTPRGSTHHRKWRTPVNTSRCHARRRLDHLVIAYRSAHVDRAHAMLGRRIDAVAEREECVGSERRARGRQLRFAGLDRAYPRSSRARLTRADADTQSHVHERVRLHGLTVHANWRSCTSAVRCAARDHAAATSAARVAAL